MNEKKTLQDQVRDVLAGGGEILQLSTVALLKHLRSLIPALQTYSDADLDEMVQIALNYEEETTPEYSLPQAIKWIKANFDKTRYYGGCIIRQNILEQWEQECAKQQAAFNALPGLQGEKPMPPMPESRYRISLCYLDKAGEPLLGADAKHKDIYCNAVAPDLERQFGTNDMIILR